MKNKIVFFLMIPISQIVLVAGYLCSQQKLGIWGMLGLLFFLLADSLFVYSLIWGARKEKVQQQLEELSYLQDTQRLRNEMLVKNEQELLQLKEKFDSELKDIHEKITCGEIRAADAKIVSIQKNLDRARAGEYCQNKIVNAVMSEKAKQCERKNIELNVELMVPGVLYMDALHICSLFSNLLDNAIEAVDNKKNQKQRWIQIHTELKGGYLIIKISNPAEEKHVERKKREGHGYGIKIIQDIVKQYDGIYKTEYKQEIYTALLAIRAV